VLAGACALAFLLLAPGNGQQSRTFGVAVAAGLVVGTVRGFTLRLEVDRTFTAVRLPSARGSLLVAVGLAGAVLLEIGAELVGPAGTPFRVVAADIAAFAAGILIGRMSAIAIRWTRLSSSIAVDAS
jgi:hypothetical protein